MSFLRRYILWIVLATVACAMGAWVVAAGQPTQFTTAATVDVEAAVIPGAAPVAPNLATEEQVATSGSVVSSAASALGLSPSQLHLSVTNKAGTNILQIACSEGSAAKATSCANAVAAAYSSFRNESTSSKAVRARDPFYVTIVTSAPLPVAKSEKRKLELVAVGVILGLGLGIGTAFLRDRLDDRIRDRADLGHHLQAPVLGEIPVLRKRSVRPEAGVIQAPQSALAEAYRHLRARISPLIASTDSQGKVVLVTSAQPSEGRTSVATNLAAVIALTGANVLLVDADLRNRALSKVFQAGEHRGLTDLLADRARIGEVINSTDFASSLSIMTAGTVTNRPGDLLDATRLQRAFAQLTVLADVVVVDSGPLRAVSDPLALVPVSDIVIVVADVRRTRRAAITAAVQEITAIKPVTIVGVLNRAARPRRRQEAPVKDMPRLQQTPVAAVHEPADSEPATNGDKDARRVLQAWRRNSVSSDTATEVRPVLRSLNPLPSENEPVVRDDEPTMFIDDGPTMLIAMESPRTHAADSAVGAAANGSASANGSTTDEGQATKGSMPPGG